MTTYNGPQFNGYAYDAAVDFPATIEEDQPGRLQVGETPGKYGQYSAGGILGARALTIKGTLAAASPSDPASIRAAWDNFKFVHRPGMPSQFWFDSNWFLRCEVKAVAASLWDGLSYRDYQVQFVASDPYWYFGDAYAESPTTEDLATGVNVVTTGTVADDSNGATAGAEPIYVIDVSALTGDGPWSLTIVNDAGESITVNIPLVTQTGTYTVDTRRSAETVTGPSGWSNLWSGEWPYLVNGANNITVTATAGEGSTITLGGDGATYVKWTDRKY